MTNPFSINDRILFGAAFYDEYRRVGSLDRDLDLMVDASFSVIRVGESVWSTWEPSPGVFHLDWLEPVLDGAHERGIDVILGTPTYAIPPWMSTMHPEIAAEVASGVSHPWGWRQEVNVAHATFREYAERIIRKVVERYVDHPSIIGFQVDNEPGPHLLHNADVFASFVDHLRAKYGTIDNLNEEWGLIYWSHTLRDWDELWLPDGNHSPQYQLEWRRFQTHVIDEFITWQAAIVREYARPDQFVTTCISYERPAVNDVSLVRSLDVTAGNPYYKMQDALRIGVEVPREEIWWSSGVWGLFEQGDRMYSSKQAPFLVTETNAQSIGQSHWQNHTPYPGQIEQAGMALIARGARMIEYWQWQTLHVGIETYWGGIMPHSGQPGRIYREVAALGQRIREIEPLLVDYEPHADVTLLYSTDTKRSFDFYPPLATEEGGPDRHAFLRIFDSFYRGAFEAGSQVRILHIEQLVCMSAEELAREHPVLVVPSLYVASDCMLERLVDYAAAGGHLIAGIRTAYADELARARAERVPAKLWEHAGIWYDEFATLDHSTGVVGEALQLGDDAAGTGWADGLQLAGAEVLATYGGGIYAGGPAVTTRAVGEGRLTYVGTVPNRALASAIVAWAVPAPRTADWSGDETIVVASGTSAGGEIYFVWNWGPDAAEVTVPSQLTDGDHIVEPGTRLTLDPWSVRIFGSALAQLTTASTSTSTGTAP